MIAAGLATMGQGARTDIAPIGAMSDAAAAKLLKVGERSVERAKAVRRDAVPELVSAVEGGQVAVSAAREFSRQPKSTQKKKIAAAGTASAAVATSHKVARQATRQSVSGAAKRPVPRRRGRDPDLFWACDSFRMVSSMDYELDQQFPEPPIFWRCLECHDEEMVMETLNGAMQKLKELLETAPSRTRH